MAGDLLFFAADDGENGNELWVSDGDVANTKMVKDINNMGDSNPHGFIEMGGMVFFVAEDGNGTELWKSDGTVAGTQMVFDINLGGAGSDPAHLTVLGNTLFFTADNGSNGIELWQSNGTGAGTQMVKKHQYSRRKCCPSKTLKSYCFDCSRNRTLLYR